MRRPGPRVYRAYGVGLQSPWRLPCPPDRRGHPADIELVDAAPTDGPAGAGAGGDWFRYARLPDGAEFISWAGLADFRVSADGRRVTGRPVPGTPPEAFHGYLLGQVLSFALLKRGLEPLHATCVAVGGGAVGFLGDCGSGKSTLGAAFLRAGHRLVTDDLLVLEERDGVVLAHPGLSRIKLFPGTGRRLLGAKARGIPMNGFTPKLLIPVEARSRGALPLTALYVLAPPAIRARTDRIAIRPLARPRAFAALTRHTFNTVVAHPARLARQFEAAAGIARRVPVRALSFPRGLGRLEVVREAICEDAAG